ncbi:MAG: hypothetical protein DRQ88_08185 [Epsilonproteobacteria bacterium]|nr:MAG: hypothetical protein DRQ89_09205 [Campylobacterota bacterium]RLA66027.1 MAG: hypothetical protein DRQ88_08185 [Campylobacterota bacterium]
MKKILLVLAFVTTSLLAQETTINITPATTSDTSSTFSFEGLLDDLRESPFSMSFFSDFGTTGGATDINGWVNETLMYLSYKLTPYDSLRLNTSLVFSDPIDAGKSAKAEWGGATLRYKRSSILTEDKHGVNMSAEVRLNLFPNYYLKKPNAYMSYSVRANFAKEFTGYFTLASTLRYDEYIRNSAAKNLSRRKFNVYINPSFSFLKSWSFTPGISFNHRIRGGTVVKIDEKTGKTEVSNFERSTHIGFVPEIGYSVNKELSMGLYWDSTPIASHDNKFLSPGWGKSSAIGYYLSYSLF